LKYPVAVYKEYLNNGQLIWKLVQWLFYYQCFNFTSFGYFYLPSSGSSFRNI